MRDPGGAGGSLRQRWWRGRDPRSPADGSPPRVPPVGPLRQAAGPSPAAGTPRGPPRPFPSAGAMSGAKGRANPGSVGSRKFIITPPPPPKLPRLCQGKCGVNVKGSESPCCGSLAPTSLFPLKPRMPLWKRSGSPSDFLGGTAVALQFQEVITTRRPRGWFLAGACCAGSRRCSGGVTLSPEQKGGFLRLPNLQECK